MRCYYCIKIANDYESNKQAVMPLKNSDVISLCIMVYLDYMDKGLWKLTLPRGLDPLTKFCLDNPYLPVMSNLTIHMSTPGCLDFFGHWSHAMSSIFIAFIGNNIPTNELLLDFEGQGIQNEQVISLLVAIMQSNCKKCVIILVDTMIADGCEYNKAISHLNNLIANTLINYTKKLRDQRIWLVVNDEVGEFDHTDYICVTRKMPCL